MRIGMMSGDYFCADRADNRITRPDYMVQGYLATRLVEMGHDVYVFTPRSIRDTLPYRVKDESEAFWSLERDNLDVLIVDRLNRYGSQVTSTVQRLREWRGPVVFNQNIFFTGWEPVLCGDHLMWKDKRWLILNRAPNPEMMSERARSQHNKIWIGMPVDYARWEPFLQMGSIWRGRLTKAGGSRPYTWGYMGRMPASDPRSERACAYIAAYDRSDKCIVGTSAEWVKERGVPWLGRASHHLLPQYLESISASPVVVAAPYENTGAWPNRVIESACAGQVQLFDHLTGIGTLEDHELGEYVVRSPKDFRDRFAAKITDPGWRREHALAQQKIILARADEGLVLRKLNAILEDFVGS